MAKEKTYCGMTEKEIKDYLEIRNNNKETNHRIGSKHFMEILIDGAKKTPKEVAIKG